MMNEEKEVKTGCWGKEGEVNKDRESEEKKEERNRMGHGGDGGSYAPLFNSTAFPVQSNVMHSCDTTTKPPDAALSCPIHIDPTQ